MNLGCARIFPVGHLARIRPRQARLWRPLRAMSSTASDQYSSDAEEEMDVDDAELQMALMMSMQQEQPADQGPNAAGQGEPAAADSWIVAARPLITSCCTRSCGTRTGRGACAAAWRRNGRRQSSPDAAGPHASAAVPTAGGGGRPAAGQRAGRLSASGQSCAPRCPALLGAARTGLGRAQRPPRQLGRPRPCGRRQCPR